MEKKNLINLYPTLSVAHFRATEGLFKEWVFRINKEAEDKGWRSFHINPDGSYLYTDKANEELIPQEQPTLKEESDAIVCGQKFLDKLKQATEIVPFLQNALGTKGIQLLPDMVYFDRIERIFIKPIIVNADNKLQGEYYWRAHYVMKLRPQADADPVPVQGRKVEIDFTWAGNILRVYSNILPTLAPKKVKKVQVFDLKKDSNTIPIPVILSKEDTSYVENSDSTHSYLECTDYLYSDGYYLPMTRTTEGLIGLSSHSIAIKTLDAETYNDDYFDFDSTKNAFDETMNYGFVDDDEDDDDYEIIERGDLDLTRINFFVSLRKDHEDMGESVDLEIFKINTPDMGLYYMIMRAKLYSRMSGGKLHVIRPRNTLDLIDKIKAKMEKVKTKYNISESLKVGSIIFDGHGHYESSESRVNIGTDYFCTETFENAQLARIEALQSLATLCDNKTKVAFGHCFAGASYHRYVVEEEKPTNGWFDTSKTLGGERLVSLFSQYLNGAIVYACESMTFMQPGVFMGGAALASFPKEFGYYGYFNFVPVWERVGQFRRAINGEPSELCNTISYNTLGEINELPYDWNKLPKVQKAIKKVLNAIEKAREHKEQIALKTEKVEIEQGKKGKILKPIYLLHHENFAKNAINWKSSPHLKQCTKP